ncbi:MAG: hypothetical protein E2O92_03910, partial [Alphaproteobacteria bacterium]
MAWQSFLDHLALKDFCVFGAGIVLGGVLIWLVTPTAPDIPAEPPVVIAEPSADPPVEAPKPPPNGMGLQAAEWSALTGWDQDDLALALATFNKSCAALLRLPADRAMDGGAFAGTADDWQPVCELAAFVPDDTDAARAFFEEAFVPFVVLSGDEAEGLFTGYYVPVVQGRLTADDTYNVPLLARPGDLVSVDLGRFDPKHAGQQIYGRVDGGRLAPYYTRAEIETGAWASQPQPLVWLDDPVEAFFLHIQGSGMVRLADGTMVRLGFAGKNGRPYSSVGRYLINENLLGRHEASMQGIKSWVAEDPAERTSVLHHNASYVFFHRQVADGAIGALDIPLTAQRSMAVDRRHIPLGAPLWL